jgi:hypothetical protein
MEFNPPLVIPMPDGTQRTVARLFPIIYDDVTRKVCNLMLHPFPKPLTLWRGEAYDIAGDYTQADVDARLLELLGDDPVHVLRGLIPGANGNMPQG